MSLTQKVYIECTLNVSARPRAAQTLDDKSWSFVNSDRKPNCLGTLGQKRWTWTGEKSHSTEHAHSYTDDFAVNKQLSVQIHAFEINFDLPFIAFMSMGNSLNWVAESQGVRTNASPQRLAFNIQATSHGTKRSLAKIHVLEWTSSAKIDSTTSVVIGAWKSTA